MKKVESVILVFILVLGLLSGCGAGKTSSDEDTQQPPTTDEEVQSTGEEGDKFVLGVINCNSVYLYYQAELAGMQAEADAIGGIELMILDSQDDINKEAANIETCITKGVDMILLISVGAEDGANCVRKANEAGVPIIAVSREVTSEKPLMNIVTGYDNTYAAIDELIDNVVVEGTVVEIAGKSGEANVIIRGDALREAIDGNENVTLIDSADCQWDQLTAANTAADMISKYPDLTAFYCHNDDMAAGVIQAVEDAGKTGEIMVIAMDGQPAALSNIAAGKQTATMGVPIALEGARCVYYAHQYLTGNEVPDYIETEIIPITKDNVETYSNLWGDINFADYPIDVSQ